MGKSRKRQRVEAKAKLLTATAVDSIVNTPDEDGGLIGGLILPDELQITIDTLTTLADNPQAFKDRGLRELKSALWAAYTAANGGGGSSPTSRVSSALADGRWADAKSALADMRVRGIRPKLGALQRWVRECDAAAAREGAVVWAVLDDILRTTAGDASVRAEAGSITRVPEWVTRPPTGVNVWEDLADGRLIPDRGATSAPFLPLQVTPGPQRRPPNQFASTVFYSPSNPLPLDPSYLSVTRLDHPSVPGAFILHNVLTVPEARAMVAAAEAVGLERDVPASGSATQLASVLADNLVWLADRPFLDTLFARVRAHLPPRMDGGDVAGVNARFRIYRYKPGNHYRPHIDGAWPASALGADEDGKPCYVYDSDPALYSRLTFLLYLNGEPRFLS